MNLQDTVTHHDAEHGSFCIIEDSTDVQAFLRRPLVEAQ
jgi:hypothetical protein